MTFIVRIFFAGLVAFVPSRGGNELTVLLPDASVASLASDGTTIEPHQALLLVRAGSCQGDCAAGDSQDAALLFAAQTKSLAGESLSRALLQGSIWQLKGSDISFAPPAGAPPFTPPLVLWQHQRSVGEGQPGPRPATSCERADFRWVADLARLSPSAGVVDPALLAPVPPANRLAARLRLTAGEVSTYRLVRPDGNVPVLRFRNLKDREGDAPYSQALADWVMAEFRVSGTALIVAERRFADGTTRSIRLTPSNGVVEIALLNVAPPHPDPSAGQHAAATEPSAPPRPNAASEPSSPPQPATASNPSASPQTATHFEKYYDLARGPQPVRPVPYLADPSGPPPPPDERRSALLDALGLGDPKGVYDRLICALAQLSDGASQ